MIQHELTSADPTHPSSDSLALCVLLGSKMGIDFKEIGGIVAHEAVGLDRRGNPNAVETCEIGHADMKR